MKTELITASAVLAKLLKQSAVHSTTVSLWHNVLIVHCVAAGQLSFMADNTRQRMKIAILSWLQNDGTRGVSKDQLKGKQLSIRTSS